MSNPPCRPRIPRRDTVRAWRRAFPLLAVYAAVVAAVQPSVLTLATLAVCAALAVPGMRADWRYSRGGMPAARKALLSALRSLEPSGATAGGWTVWVNRDEHLVFAVRAMGPPGFRTVLVARVPEDDAETLFREGAANISTEVYRVMPVFLPVYHEMGVDPVTIGADGEPVYPEPGKREQLARVWRNFRMERTGVLYAGPEEIRQLIGQLGGAEAVMPD